MLEETLASLARMRVAPEITWDVVVVDNNSTDDTAEVVRASQARYPAPLYCVREERQGKSFALNTGLTASQSTFVLFTDDDVRVEPGWLEASIAPMMADASIDYTGGPVRPIWGARRPRWLGDDRADLWGAIAILDYGPAPLVFEEQGRIPIGANMAVRRTLIDAIGGFAPELGRKGNSLLGQEQAEFFCRTRAHGARGLYVPDMELHHHVPARRLTRRYFRQWWVWKGISRARLHRMHPRADSGVDIQAIKRIRGVPRFMIGEMLRHTARLVASLVRRDLRSSVEHEMMLAYYAGYAWEDWRRHEGRRRPANGPR